MARTVVSLKEIEKTRNKIKESLAYAVTPSLVSSLSGTNISPTVDKIVDNLSLKPDDYAARLLKYIPTEVIALYLTLDTLMRKTASGPPLSSNDLWLYWSAFGFAVIITPLYLWRMQGVSKPKQLAISTISLAVWVFAMGGPFSNYAWYSAHYAAALLPAYTLLVSVVEA